MEIKLSLTKIFTGVVTAITVGAIFGALALIRTSDSIVFRVIAIELDNADIKRNTVPRNEIELSFKHLNDRLEISDRKYDERHEENQKQLNRIESKL